MCLKFLKINLLCILLCIVHHSALAQPSRARGAILFMNYCSGCHSLQYLAWPRMVQDLELDPQTTLSITPQLRLSLPSFASTWPQIALDSQEATQWFGKPPPDLSLVSRQRGSAWILAYLQGFYPDHLCRFGVNNHQFPNTMMPNVLESFPGDAQKALADITAFLAYAAEPSIVIRHQLRWFVVGFVLIWTLLFWLWMRKR